jgi:Leucine-rich repeat (LRR) protein
MASTVDPIIYENQDITINGTHKANYGNSDVADVSFLSDSGLNYIPSKMFDIFQNVQQFYAYESHITTMTTNAFRNCSKMIYITLMNNNFPIIPASFAESCTNINYLLLHNNSIQSLHKDAFKGLVNLIQVALYYNKIAYIEPGTFQNAPSLANLALSWNLITDIHPSTYTGMTNLTYIDLMYNNLTVLPSLDLTNMPSLYAIYIYDNDIWAIDPQFFETFPGPSGPAGWYIMLKANNCTNEDFSLRQ